MKDALVATRYSRALFELGEKEQKLAEIDQTLHWVATFLADHPQVFLLVSNPTLSEEEKSHLAQSILSDTAPELLRRFFKVLIEKKRFCLLPEIQKIFHKCFEQKQGIQEVEIASVIGFSPVFLEKLRDILRKKLRSEIRLIPKTEPDLLGGFVLRFDGKEVDCSFKNRIEEIQQKFLHSLNEETPHA